jgi:enoyl-CoA hydratase/carnithine racemase
MSMIKVEKEGHILKIAMARPEKYNAFTVEMYHQIALAYGQLNDDPELRVGLFYGEGDHFTSGLELTDWSATLSAGKLPSLPKGSIDPFALSGPKLTKPIVMAVQGYCYTCGVEMMLNTDIRVAANNTRFAQLEVQRGLYACGGATMRLQRELGWANAQRYLLTGDEWSAEDAYRMGMVQELCEPGEQYERAFSIATSIANAAPLGVQGSLQSSQIARDEGEHAAIKSLFKDLVPVMASEDMKEGIQSFIERRSAKFKGY